MHLIPGPLHLLDLEAVNTNSLQVLVGAFNDAEDLFSVARAKAGPFTKVPVNALPYSLGEVLQGAPQFGSFFHLLLPEFALKTQAFEAFEAFEAIEEHEDAKTDANCGRDPGGCDLINRAQPDSTTSQTVLPARQYYQPDSTTSQTQHREDQPNSQDVVHKKNLHV